VAGCILANIRVADPLKYATYTTTVWATAEDGGRFLVRGGRAEAVEGFFEPCRIALIEFCGLEHATAWLSSRKYRHTMVHSSASTTDLVVAKGV
jgi:uncharacterized protein (DUF1330 family)